VQPAARMIKALLVCVLVVAGCGGDKVKTPQDIEAEYGPRLRPRVQAIIAAGVVANANRSELGAAGSGPSDVDLDANTLLVHAEDLERADANGEPPLRLVANLRDDPFRVAKSWTGAKAGLQAGDFRIFENDLQRVIAAKYVLVVFVDRHVRPDMGLAGTTFKPGAVEATLVLVEIDGARPRGGVHVTATSSSEITTRRVSGAGALEERQRQVDADLVRQLDLAIRGAVGKRWKR
jgi:hypothetical protein